MIPHEAPVPPIYSVQRFTTLIASVIVALASGTNYVFSAYGPQLATRLGMTHTQLNIVALGGNIGVYSSGPIWGKIVDSRGPRILLACAFCFLLTGYLGMRHMFDAGLSEGETAISLIGFAILTLCCYLTGAGGNGGLTSSVNSTAKTFPDEMRATTTGFVISGFGLSAFLFSSVSHAFFAGNTSSFLLLLGAGTALPMVMGFFLIRYIPLPSQESRHPDEAEHEEHAGLAGARSPLLEEEREDGAHLRSGYNSEEGSSTDGDVELSPQHRPRQLHARNLSRGSALVLDKQPNVYGLRLWKTLDFYLLFFSLSLLSGTGLMYINNVGSMAQALYAFENPNYDPIKAAKWQATQVSTISINNCLGRIAIGVISDFTKNRFQLPRSYCLVLVALVLFLSQVVASRIDSVGDLWMSSTVLGWGYGAAFSLFPTVCMEWFGLAHFSENWGYLSMSPMFAGNLFSLVFGYTLDRNDDKHISAPSGGSNTTTLASAATHGVRSRLKRGGVGVPVDIRCSRGLDCYVTSLYLTMGATLVALGLTIWASVRDRRKVAMAMQRRSQRRRAAIVAG